MKFRIISAVLRKPWFIDEQYAIAHSGIVASLLNGDYDFDASVDQDVIEEVQSLPYAVSAASPGKKYSVFDEAPQGSIAVIPVRGPLMKEDEYDCGTLHAGMNTLGSRVMEADNHPNIDGILLYMDTPGGTADGTQAFADKIKSAQKPVVAFVDGLMASAGMWIGSSAKRIIAQNSTAEIGSIGVMMGWADMKPKWENEGVKFHRIVSDRSKDKNKGFYDAEKGDYELMKAESLNPLADQFIQAVKENRPGVSESVMTGKVYFAEDALKLGLIDEIGSFEHAVDVTSELIQDHKKNNKQATSLKTKITMDKLPLLCALLGVEALEVTDDGVFLNTEQLEAIEQKLTENAAAIEAVNQDTEATEQLNLRIEELENDLAAALKLPASETATTVSKTNSTIAKVDINAELENLTMAERMAKLSE